MSTVALDCPRCGEQTLHRRAITVNAWPHIILAILSCGLWLIVWLVREVRAECSLWRCLRCGNQQDFDAGLALLGERGPARVWIYYAAAAGFLFIGLPLATFAVIRSLIAVGLVAHH